MGTVVWPSFVHPAVSTPGAVDRPALAPLFRPATPDRGVRGRDTGPGRSRRGIRDGSPVQVTRFGGVRLAKTSVTPWQANWAIRVRVPMVALPMWGSRVV